jgi:UDP-N-acetylglucosamine transferase subunit ALG13
MVNDEEAANGNRRSLRICLAASGGGHIRQLLDLEPVWGAHDHFFITEDTALSRSISERHRVHYLPHFAKGQVSLDAPFRAFVIGARNFAKSLKVVLDERPNVLITTGAGTVFFAALFARLIGAKTVVIESFARFNKPSLFARLAAPFAHRMIVQSQGLAAYWPNAAVFDPMRQIDRAAPAKRPLLFATVGAILPFDRLVRTVAELKVRGDIPEEVVIQTGRGGFVPAGIETIETLPFDEIQSMLQDADIVVCHGGTGSLITALRQGCRVIAVPRLVEKGEAYDNHQAQITQAFADRGLIGVANTVDEMAAALKAVRSRPPVLATSDPAELIEYLNDLLAAWFER